MTQSFPAPLGRGCRREHRAQLISGEQYLRPQGGGRQTLQRHSSQKLWPGGDPAPWRVSLASAAHLSPEGSRLLGLAGLGSSAAGVRARADAESTRKPFCGALCQDHTGAGNTLEGSLAPESTLRGQEGRN